MRGRIPLFLRKSCAALLLSASLVVGGAGVVSAESIHDALANAYSGNPTLNAERARQRATDEQVPQALSGWRPTISAGAQANLVVQDRDQSGGPGTLKPNTTFPAEVNIGLSQPVFRGFKTVEGTKLAESNVLAGRQNLLAVEQQVLFNAAQAYMNVLRDRQRVAFRGRNVAALREQLRGAQERFNVGEVTRTDVAQANARLNEAQAALAQERASLASSTANYQRVVGHKPGKLRYPKIVKLPKSLETALAIAKKTNPNILAASYVADASRHAIEVEKGDLLPTVSLEANAARSAVDLSQDRIESGKYRDELTVSGVVRVPLYTAGRDYSEIREAKQVASQRQIQILESARSVRESVTASWSFVVESRAEIAAARAQVEAARLALEGVKQEALVGSRTTLDVLDAEQEVTNARLTLANAERDLIVAAYQVLGSMGKLTARNLSLDVVYYDPEENYRNVRDKWWGTDADTIE
jgi:TolC family type I secretion outer membrane protein